MDPTSQVPQLIVTLRYSDMHAPVPTEVAPAGRGWAPPPSPASSADDLAAVEEASAKMKGALARNLTRVGPAVERLAERAKTMVALLAKRREDRSPVRRTTAPAPGGGLHATGRRVVRGDEGSPGDPGANDAAAPRTATTKRKATIAAAVMLAAVVGAIAIKKSHHDGAEAAAPAASGSTATDVAPPGSAAPATAPPEPTGALSQPPAAAPQPLAADDSDGRPAATRSTCTSPPSATAPCTTATSFASRWTRPIESIEGAQQPTGFTVKIPGRKAVEAAAPLAARDSRIAAIKVANEGAGAELSVTFKDGVPNYQVSAHGDTLVIALAPVGSLDETMAKKDEKGGKSKHAKHKKGEEQF